MQLSSRVMIAISIAMVISYTLSDFLIQSLTDLPLYHIALFRYGLGLIFMLPFIRKDALDLASLKRSAPWHLARVVLFVPSPLLGLYVLRHDTVSLLAALNLTKPAIVVGFQLLFLSEKLGKMTILMSAVFLSCFLLLFVGDSSVNPIVLCAGFISIILVSASNMLIRMGPKEERVVNHVLIYHLAGVATFLAICTYYQDWSFSPSLVWLAAPAALGVFSNYGLALITKYSTSEHLPGLDAFRVVFAFLVEYAILGIHFDSERLFVYITLCITFAVWIAIQSKQQIVNRRA